MRFEIKCDFDGTITRQDSTDFVLENFAASEWEVIERKWKEGKISSTECMELQTKLINSTPEKIAEKLKDVEVDDSFSDFVKLCDFWNVDLSILSDGYDFNIHNILSRMGLENLHIDSNKLEYLGDKNFKFIAQHHAPHCRQKSGPCKCSKINHAAYTILIGDGRSDFCAAQSSDIVIAKDSLLTFCRNKGIPHIPFKNFKDVKRIVNYLLMNRVPSTLEAGISRISTKTTKI